MAGHGFFVFILVVISIIASFTAKAEMQTDEFLRKVDEFITAGMSCHQNPGLAVSVVKDGQVLLAKGYGNKTVDESPDNQVTNQTLFGIASLSKAFASAALLRVLEDIDNVTLKTTVADVLDGADVFYGYLRQRYATLEDLLTHRLGIPSNNKLRFDDTLTRSNLVERMKYLKPVGSFRSSFYYSNICYGLATYVTEKLGGKSWEEIVTSQIFQPLGMTSSTFMTTANIEEINLAKGYYENDGALYPVPFELNRQWGLLCGAGCVMSTAADMTRWMMFHLEGGINKDNKRVLAKSSMEAAHKGVIPVPESSVHKYYTRPLTPVTLSHETYALGWGIGHYRGYPIWTHSGSTYGYRAYITLIPGINAGIFVAMTGDDYNYFFRRSIHNFIADLLMNEQPWLNETTVCTFPEPWQPQTQPSGSGVRTGISAQRSLQAYVGTYKNPSYGKVKVYVNTTKNALMAKYGIVTLQLFPKTDKDDFSAVPTGPMRYIFNFTTFTFKFDTETDLVTQLVVPDFETEMPPIFVKQSLTTTAETHASPTTPASGKMSVSANSGLVAMCFALFVYCELWLKSS